MTAQTTPPAGDIPHSQPLSPSLPCEVRKRLAVSPAAWASAGWCPSVERAIELAAALVAWRGVEQAHVWAWSTAGPVLLHRADAAADRPAVPDLPAKPLGRYRPEGVGADLAAEPEWPATDQTGHLLRVRYALHTWSPTERAAAA